MATLARSLPSAQPRNMRRRGAVDRAATVAMTLVTAGVLLLLVAIIGSMLWKGFHALNWAFLTHGPTALGEPGGGMAHAILGSVLLLGFASVTGVPVGIGAGIYLAEFGSSKSLLHTLRFVADVLSGVPSIVIGIVVYVCVVERQGHFSAFAGGVSLALLMIPVVARTTEDMLRTVPVTVREAAWGLGLARWRTVLSISLRAALPGVVTGCILAFARAAGETAPLLFTAFGSQFVSFRIGDPIAALPLQIYVYALSPYEEWHRLAWAGALVLIALIVAALGLLRLVARRGRMQRGR